MKLTHRFAELTPERRPQDPNMDGTGMRFETLEHGGEYPDAMPQAIKLIDAKGRSCVYVPIIHILDYAAVLDHQEPLPHPACHQVQ